MNVYIAGEDEVTKAIIKRLLAYVSSDFKIVGDIPARGSEIKSKISQFNELAKTTPVIMLLDADSACAPALKEKLLNGSQKEENFILNICIDEAEAWLMADRDGFSHYFGIAISMLPHAKPLKQGGRKALIEMDFPAKSSFLLTHKYAIKSHKAEVRKTIGVVDSNAHCKGKEYNSMIVPFIVQKWNIDAARKKSNSLERMIGRLMQLKERLIEK